MSHCTILSKRNQNEYQCLFQLLHILIIHKIKYVLHSEIEFLFYKTLDFVEMMIEFQEFSILGLQSKEKSYYYL